MQSFLIKVMPTSQMTHRNLKIPIIKKTIKEFCQRYRNSASSLLGLHTQIRGETKVMKNWRLVRKR